MAPASSLGKRKSAGGSHHHKAAEKKQKLPVRAKSVSSPIQKPLLTETPVSSSSRSRMNEKRAKDETKDDDDDDDVDDSDVFKTPLENKHFVFGEDDQEDVFVTPPEGLLRTAPQSGRSPLAAEEGSEEEDESDDDAPPEAVSSHQAAKESMKSLQAASKAAEQQVTAQKHKRRKRDTLLKEQAQARKHSSGPTKTEAANPFGDLPDIAADYPTQLPTQEGRPRRRPEIPLVLPPELLESDGEEDLDVSDIVQERKSEKIRFDDVARREAQEGKRPRDERVGTTIYRVLPGKEHTSMAPKMNRGSRDMKLQLLRRRRAPRGRNLGFFGRK